MRPTVAIFGSCVTRDLFEDERLKPRLAFFTSRSSLISAVAPPVPLDAASVVLESAFQRRCVIQDFQKVFFAQLAETRPEWLVIDLIDERFEVVRAADSFVTRSLAFVHAGLDELGHEAVRRLTDEAAQLLDDAVARFAARTLELMPAERIIVHRAHWLTRFRRGAAIEPFDDRRREFAERHNAALERGYDALELAFGGRARVVALGSDDYVADADHHWGLEPYHYEHAYTAAAVEALLGITSPAALVG